MYVQRMKLRLWIFCLYLFRLFFTLFSFIGIICSVLLISFVQVRELSRLTNEDSSSGSTFTSLCKKMLSVRGNNSHGTQDCGSILHMPALDTDKRFEIRCQNSVSSSVMASHSEDRNPYKLSFRDSCLKLYIRQHCYDGYKVPRLVHYVWFSQHTMDVYAFLSILSASKFLEPCVILLHGDYLPLGPYWKKLLFMVNNIIFVHRQPPLRIFGKRLGYIQHKSDIARIEALREYGGIYLDSDQLVLRSFDDLRNYDFVMGHETPKNLGNSVLVSVPDAEFLKIWYSNYQSYNPKQWGIHSTFVPFRLALKFPELIHMENDTLIHPELSGIESVYSGHYNWTRNYAIHLYPRWVKKFFSLQHFRHMDTALGEIVRHILYDSQALCSS